ncbi:hypothetical protein WJX79_006509 [Trebouxia sp. C0005]
MNHEAQATSVPVTDRMYSRDNGEGLGATSSGKTGQAVQKGQGKNQQQELLLLASTSHDLIQPSSAQAGCAQGHNQHPSAHTS